ncbi:MAG: endolytic transglycosylase MltG [Bacteroidales bacterium]
MAKHFHKTIIKYSIILATLLLLIGGYFGYVIYKKMFAQNIDLGEDEQTYIHIPTGSNYSDVLSILDSTDYIINMESFKWVCSRMGYPYSVKPGRYLLEDGMNNKTLVTKLRAGLQTPVKVTFTGFRTPEQFAQRISNQIEADSAEIVNAFLSDSIPNEYGFTKETFIAMFIPNTYEIFWNTSAKGFFNRMKREYEAFWTDAKDQKAMEAGLDRVGVSIIASIVQEETIKADELPKIAGVFINRLNTGIALQACPTVKFALNDFTIRRVLKQHTTINSPYNTYKHRGLPPGPINAPNISSINAVLNYEKHNYFYFSASPDFSGYHIFSKTLNEHNRNARKYQGILNRERIYR